MDDIIPYNIDKSQISLYQVFIKYNKSVADFFKASRNTSDSNRKIKVIQDNGAILWGRTTTYNKQIVSNANDTPQSPQSPQSSQSSITTKVNDYNGSYEVTNSYSFGYIDAELIGINCNTILSVTFDDNNDKNVLQFMKVTAAEDTWVLLTSPTLDQCFNNTEIAFKLEYETKKITYFLTTIDNDNKCIWTVGTTAKNINNINDQNTRVYLEQTVKVIDENKDNDDCDRDKDLNCRFKKEYIEKYIACTKLLLPNTEYDENKDNDNENIDIHKILDCLETYDLPIKYVMLNVGNSLNDDDFGLLFDRLKSSLNILELKQLLLLCTSQLDKFDMVYNYLENQRKYLLSPIERSPIIDRLVQHIDNIDDDFYKKTAEVWDSNNLIEPLIRNGKYELVYELINKYKNDNKLTAQFIKEIKNGLDKVDLIKVNDDDSDNENKDSLILILKFIYEQGEVIRDDKYRYYIQHLDNNNPIREILINAVNYQLALNLKELQDKIKQLSQPMISNDDCQSLIVDQTRFFGLSDDAPIEDTQFNKNKFYSLRDQIIKEINRVCSSQLAQTSLAAANNIIKLLKENTKINGENLDDKLQLKQTVEQLKQTLTENGIILSNEYDFTELLSPAIIYDATNMVRLLFNTYKNNATFIIKFINILENVLQDRKQYSNTDLIVPANQLDIIKLLLRDESINVIKNNTQSLDKIKHLIILLCSVSQGDVQQLIIDLMKKYDILLDGERLASIVLNGNCTVVMKIIQQLIDRLTTHSLLETIISISNYSTDERVKTNSVCVFQIVNILLTQKDFEDVIQNDGVKVLFEVMLKFGKFSVYNDITDAILKKIGNKITDEQFSNFASTITDYGNISYIDDLLNDERNIKRLQQNDCTSIIDKCLIDEKDGYRCLKVAFNLLTTCPVLSSKDVNSNRIPFNEIDLEQLNYNGVKRVLEIAPYKYIKTNSNFFIQFLHKINNEQDKWFIIGLLQKKLGTIVDDMLVENNIFPDSKTVEDYRIRHPTSTSLNGALQKNIDEGNLLQLETLFKVGIKPNAEQFKQVFSENYKPKNKNEEDIDNIRKAFVNYTVLYYDRLISQMQNEINNRELLTSNRCEYWKTLFSNELTEQSKSENELSKVLDENTIKEYQIIQKNDRIKQKREEINNQVKDIVNKCDVMFQECENTRKNLYNQYGILLSKDLDLDTLSKELQSRGVSSEQTEYLIQKALKCSSEGRTLPINTKEIYTKRNECENVLSDIFKIRSGDNGNMNHINSYIEQFYNAMINITFKSEEPIEMLCNRFKEQFDSTLHFQTPADMFVLQPLSQSQLQSQPVSLCSNTSPTHNIDYIYYRNSNIDASKTLIHGSLFGLNNNGNDKVDNNVYFRFLQQYLPFTGIYSLPKLYKNPYSNNNTDNTNKLVQKATQFIDFIDKISGMLNSSYDGLECALGLLLYAPYNKVVTLISVGCTIALFEVNNPKPILILSDDKTIGGYTINNEGDIVRNKSLFNYDNSTNKYENFVTINFVVLESNKIYNAIICDNMIDMSNNSNFSSPNIAVVCESLKQIEGTNFKAIQLECLKPDYEILKDRIDEYDKFLRNIEININRLALSKTDSNTDLNDKCNQIDESQIEISILHTEQLKVACALVDSDNNNVTPCSSIVKSPNIYNLINKSTTSATSNPNKSNFDIDNINIGDIVKISVTHP